MALPKFHLKTIQEVTYGPSIADSEHNEWRRHRKIAGPSFTEDNNALVWESTIEIILGYFIKWNRDGKGSVVKVSDFTEVTKRITFMVFSTAGPYAICSLSCLIQMISGFGINADWDLDKNEIPNGHTMTFMNALATTTRSLPALIMFPRWLLLFNKWGREAICSRDEAEVGHLNTFHQWPNLTL